MSRPRWRYLVALWLLGVAGAAVAGVLAAMQEEAVAYSEPAPRFTNLTDLVPPYPGAAFFPMGDSLNVDGFTREMGYALSGDLPAKVADRYEAIWRSQGFKVERQARQTEQRVTATAQSDPWMRTVVATLSGERTAIVASVREVFATPQPPATPVPRFCKVVSYTGGRDQGIMTEMVFLSCEGYLRELVEFYDGALHGTRRIDRFAAQTDDPVHITYSGSELEVMLSASQLADDPPRTVASVTWQERR